MMSWFRLSAAPASWVPSWPQAPRPFKAWGYPFTPAIFVLASLAIVVNAVYTNPVVTGWGLLVILAGIPVYWWFSSRR